MKKILVTGGNGQLGSELKFLSNGYPDYVFTFTDYQELDITNLVTVVEMMQDHQYYAVINCAAYTAVDKAESEREKAYLINETGAKNLAIAAKLISSKMVHISTDFIFDGSSSTPIIESAIAAPQSVYGASKLAGELAVLSACPSSLIFRTSWVYSSYGANFVKTMIKLCTEREQLSVIYDQIGTPTYARDLAQMILDKLEISIEKNINGVYHYSNEGVASWYDFAIAIRDLAGLKTPILPIETIQYPTPATRPKYSVLSKKKIKDTFQIGIPYWRASLAKCIKAIVEVQESHA